MRTFHNTRYDPTFVITQEKVFRENKIKNYEMNLNCPSKSAAVLK